MSEHDDIFGWVGHELGGAAIKAVAARGGFGVVYRARHHVFGADVAIKCLELRPTLTDAERRRFLRFFLGEARALYRLTRLTSSIVQPLNVGEARSPRGVWTPWLMLEWLDGRTLREELATRRKGMPLSDAVELLEPIAEALAYAHVEGIAHRDVNPANIFVWQRGKRRATKLLDFGIAKFMRGDGAGFMPTTTTDDHREATLRYAAPEQLSTEFGKTGPASDVYALALVLVECVVGRPVNDGDLLQILRRTVDSVRRPTPRALGVRIDDAVEQVFQEALAIDPRARFADAGAFWNSLHEALPRRRRRE